MTLTGITWDHPRGYSPLKASSEIYEQLFGVEVEWQIRSLRHFGDQSLPELADQFDLLIIDHPHAGVACQTNCLCPLDELLPKETINKFREQSAGPSFSSYHYKGKQWAIPVDAAVQCSSVRRDLMGDLQFPKNWTEVFELTALLKKQHLQVGMALSPTDCLCTFLTITAQLGSPIEEGRDMLMDPVIAMQSLELMRTMRDNFHENSLHWNPIQLYDYMSTQDDIAYAPLAFCYSNYSREGFRKNKLGYSSAPGAAHSVLGGAGIAVSAKSKYLQEAALYAAWIGSAEIQGSVYLASEGQPANIRAWKSGYANELTDNFFLNVFDALTSAYTRPRYNGWPPFQQYLGEVLHAYLLKDDYPITVLDNLQQVYELSYQNSNPPQ
jgi:multiple sugar transport system substrate-binding protein